VYSGKFIRLPNRIESNRNFFARIGMLYHTLKSDPDAGDTTRHEYSNTLSVNEEVTINISGQDDSR